MTIKKESKGRQKIKMVRIKNPSHRQVTFSKRRLGLFKKASEICTLCGIEVFIIVFSPGQKIFSFGYPNVETLVNRFLSGNTSPQITSNSPVKSEGVPQNPNLRELNSQLTQICDLLEAEKNRGDMFDNMRKSSQMWWEAPIDKLGLQELEVLSASIEDLKRRITNHVMFLENNSISQHFDLKSIEAKVDGFCLPHQIDNFDAPKFF
ncbi:hypothetical protein RND81_02G101700 [Saponaria officinalis]|uniref:MADS-box domain-containing protein n=1 Tax=Saponaria officinalis TaxID=3572 RepID=A0AAW1MRV9_SAPOF